MWSMDAQFVKQLHYEQKEKDKKRQKQKTVIY